MAAWQTTSETGSLCNSSTAIRTRSGFGSTTRTSMPTAFLPE